MEGVNVDSQMYSSVDIHISLHWQGVTDPEAKRKAIGAEFIDCFKDFRDEFKAKHGVSPRYLVQVCGAPCAVVCS
jgi:GMP synthase PP-ATPase subunit